MNKFKTSFVAAGLLLATALPSSAVTSGEVISAMNSRIGEISSQISNLQGQIRNASSAADRVFLMRQVRVLNVRRGQLRSLSRIVPRYNERFLTRIVTHFNLDVSLA